MSEINPRPWRYDPGEEEILSADGILVADLVEPGDGELIARACNSHDALIEACEDLMKPHSLVTLQEAKDRARTAIKLAKGEA